MKVCETVNKANFPSMGKSTKVATTRPIRLQSKEAVQGTKNRVIYFFAILIVFN